MNERVRARATFHVPRATHQTCILDGYGFVGHRLGLAQLCLGLCFCFVS